MYLGIEVVKMLEVAETTKLGTKVIVKLVDDTSGKVVIFGFPEHLYSEKFLKEKIAMLDKTGVASVEGVSPALNLVGKKFDKFTESFV